MAYTQEQIDAERVKFANWLGLNLPDHPIANWFEANLTPSQWRQFIGAMLSIAVTTAVSGQGFADVNFQQNFADNLDIQMPQQGAPVTQIWAAMVAHPQYTNALDIVLNYLIKKANQYVKNQDASGHLIWHEADA